MKNTLLQKIIWFLLLNVAVGKSQTIGINPIIIERGNVDNLPDDFLTTGNYYYKDLNNYYNSFIATWEYENGNEKLQIILTKVIEYHCLIPALEYDFYEDGIYIQYKKYTNNVLIYSSIAISKPTLYSNDGVFLDGFITDYGRIGKTITAPITGVVLAQGGEPLNPLCRIKKLETTNNNQMPQISFNLYHTNTINYDRETYSDLPPFSIPENIVLTKVQ